MIARTWRQSLSFWALAALMALLAVALWEFVLSATYADRQFLWLADAFRQGRLWLTDEAILQVSMTDIVTYKGHFYWPLGPLPAVLLVPGVALFGVTYPVQGVLHAALGVAAFALAYALARGAALARQDALWAATALVGGSVFVGVLYVGMPWHLGNILAATLLLGALLARQRGARAWVIGTLLGLALAARITMVWAVLYFALDAWLGASAALAQSWRDRLRRLVPLLAPVALALALLGAYNYARFDSPLTVGQGTHYLESATLQEQRSHGVFALRNIPRNFHAYFLAMPEWHEGLPIASPFGLSALLLSPAFFWLACARRSRELALAAVAAGGCLLMYLCYFGTGFLQFGPRYLVDTLPLWYMVLLSVYAARGVTAAAKIIITASVLLNLFLFGLFFHYRLY